VARRDAEGARRRSGRSSIVIVSPRESTAACSSVFASSRTLPRPAIGGEDLAGFGGETQRAAPVAEGETREQVVSERVQILRAFPQGREGDCLHHGNAPRCDVM
jgi:hypothetical protein